MSVFTSAFVFPTVLTLRAAIMISSAMMTKGDARLIPPVTHHRSIVTSIERRQILH